MKTTSQNAQSAQAQIQDSHESPGIAALGRDPKGTVKTPSGTKIKTNYQVGIQSESYPNAVQGMYHPAMGMYKINLDRLSLADYYFMKDYYQIRSAFAIMSFTLQSVNWWIEGGSAEVRDAVSWQIEHLWADIMRVITKAYWAGFSPAVKLYDIDSNTGLLYINKLRDLSPFMCKIVQDPTDQSFNGFVQKSGTFKTFDEFGNEKTYEKPAQYVEPKYAFWYSYMMEEGNFYGTKLLKGAYMPWFFSQVIHLYENRYYYRFSSPTVVGHAPGGIIEDEDGNKANAQEIMLDIVKEVRNNSSVSIPSTRDESGNSMWDIKYLESLMRGYDFESYQKRLDKEMSRAVFLPDLIFDTGRVGSYKLGESHKDTYLMLLNANVNDLKIFIDKYIIQPFVENNFPSVNGKAVEIPRFSYDKQGTLSSSIIPTLIEEMIKGGKIDIDVNKLAMMTGIPLRKAKQEEKPAVETEKPKDPSEGEPAAARKASTIYSRFEESAKNSTSAAVLKSMGIEKESETLPIEGKNFYNEITSIAVAQVGRIVASLEAGKSRSDVHVGFRAKLEKIWKRYVAENTDGLYDNLQLLVSEVLASSKTASEIRDTLWSTVTGYYLLVAKKVNKDLNTLPTA